MEAALRFLLEGDVPLPGLGVEGQQPGSGYAAGQACGYEQCLGALAEECTPGGAQAALQATADAAFALGGARPGEVSACALDGLYFSLQAYRASPRGAEDRDRLAAAARRALPGPLHAATLGLLPELRGATAPGAATEQPLPVGGITPACTLLPDPYAPEVVALLAELVEEDTDGAATVRLVPGKGRGLFLKDFLLKGQILLQDPPDLLVVCGDDEARAGYCACCGMDLCADGNPEAQMVHVPADQPPNAPAVHCSCHRCGDAFCSAQCCEMSRKYQGHDTLCAVKETPVYQLARSSGLAAVRRGGWGSSSESGLLLLHALAALVDRLVEEVGAGVQRDASALEGSHEDAAAVTEYYGSEKYQAGGKASHGHAVLPRELWRVYPDLLMLSPAGRTELGWYSACGIPGEDSDPVQRLPPELAVLLLTGVAIRRLAISVHLRPSVLLALLSALNNNGFSGMVPGATVGITSVSGFHAFANHSCSAGFQRIRWQTPLGGQVYALCCTETAQAGQEVCLDYAGPCAGGDAPRLKRRIDILATHGIPVCGCATCQATLKGLRAE